MTRQNRYIRNGLTISESDQIKLSQSKVCVIGCGGLGGYIIELLARAGLGELLVVDGDDFDESNLNRQLLSNQDNLMKNKASEAKKRVTAINRQVKVVSVCDYINKENINDLLNNYDLVMDALDSIKTRKMLVKVCEELKIPYIYGAIAGWYGQVATIMPGDHTLDLLYQSDIDKGQEERLGNPSFTPSLVASIQVSEGIKVLLGKGKLLINGFLYIDLLNNEIEKMFFE